MAKKANRAPSSSVFFMAAKDLRDEKLITLCIVLSVVAVLTPIMLLTSVKVGFIDRLRSEFIDDPTFREIRPSSADLRTDAFFNRVSGWKNVDFVMPSVMLVPREVDVAVDHDGKVKRSRAKLWPSAPGDPILTKIHGQPPTGDGVVISADIARSEGVTLESPIEISATRIENDKRRRIAIAAIVVGIIPDDAVPQPTILAAAEVDRQIESYRAGIAVPERGWKGINPVPRQSYARLLIASEEPLGETDASNLRIRVGAARMLEVAREEVPALFLPNDRASAVSLPPERTEHFALLEKDGRPYTDKDVADAAEVLRNVNARVIGVNPALGVTLDGRAFDLVGLDPWLFENVMTTPDDWAVRPAAAYALNDSIFLPQELSAKTEEPGAANLVQLAVDTPEDWPTQSLAIDVRVAGCLPTDMILASPALLAMINRGRSVPVAYDAIAKNIVEQSAGFRGFRAVASNIDAVPALVEKFQEAGIAVRAKSDEILKLQKLERSLNVLILVVAAVALAGGYAILSSSFFANVQRKRVDYATMRLIGMQKRAVFRIPIAQALIVGLFGLAFSIALYFGTSLFLNEVVAPALDFDGQLSKLYFSHFVFIGLFTVFAACLASLAASREATRVDPAQALRAG